MEGRAGGSIGRMEGANHSSHGQQMNDARNQYLGAGVEIRAVVAAMASLAAQEAWSGLGGMKGSQSVMQPPFPFTSSTPQPLSLLSSPSPHLCIASPCGWAQGQLAKRYPTQKRQRTWGLLVLEEPCPVPTCLWTPEPN